MGYSRPCPICGANLDPGEICEDCKNIKDEKTDGISGTETEKERGKKDDEPGLFHNS